MLCLRTSLSALESFDRNSRRIGWLAMLIICAVLRGVGAQQQPHVVFLVGEQEYGSAETMPPFAARVQGELGLRTTVLQSKGRELPGLAALDSADLLVLFLRFRTVEDGQLERLKKWFDDGRPCIALRTTSHAFVEHKGWFPPFFGGHYKAHAPNGKGTVVYTPPVSSQHELLHGVLRSVEWGYGGTYNAQPLADRASAVLFGRTGMLPAEPVAWTHRYRPESRIFYTSLGSKDNFAMPDFQRMLGNAVLWCLKKPVPIAGAFAGKQQSEFAPVVAASLPSPPALAAPTDARVLFDGSDLSAFRHWDPSVEPRAIGIDRRADSSSGGERYQAARWRIEGKVMVARPGFGDVVTAESFGNYHLHADVLVPPSPPWARSQFRGNSGIYLAGRYELQILDSHGDAPDKHSMGAVFGQRAPAVNAAAQAGTWQSLDVFYRHDLGRRPVISAWLNGTQIHDAVLLRRATTYGFLAPEDEAGEVAGSAKGRFARAPGESFDFGDGDFTIGVRFRAQGDGTLVSKCPPAGKWRPNSKALFLRGGHLVYDIGWVGAMRGKPKCDDGKWHRVVLTHREGTARMFVDGALVAERENFVAKDERGHVFKIGAASTDFAGKFEGDVELAMVLEHNISGGKARQWTRGEVVNLGPVALSWQPLADEQTEVAEQVSTAVRAPIRFQADSCEVRFANIWARPLGDVDHRSLARPTAARIARGKHLYQSLCASCHRQPRESFRGGLKRGSDAMSIYQTLETGFGPKPSMAWVPPRARYDVIHYLRDQLALAVPTAQELAKLPAGLPSGGAVSMSAKDEGDWPAYRRMDYGNALHWTYEVDDKNIVQKGIALRLDDGPGGVSRGRAFAVYDQDTMRLAAAWTGPGFVDWRGVAFDGSHNSHAHIDGGLVFANANEPGWANPATGSFEDERLVGRDGKRYGPLPRQWLRFLGRQQIGGRSVLEYTVGKVLVREAPSFDDTYGVPVFLRTLEVGKSAGELLVRVAPSSTAVALLAVGDERPATLEERDGFLVARIPAGLTMCRYHIAMTTGDRRLLAVYDSSDHCVPLPARDAAGAPLWAQRTVADVQKGDEDGAYAVDVFQAPDQLRNPWRSWMRFGGFDFLADGKSGDCVVATWNGDVWLVDEDAGKACAGWRRIAAGLFQPLGVKVVDGAIYVSCRDQICVLEDRNGDGEADYYRCFNNDHQVTEHFHEFAMGLQTDESGNFYYCKSARHALTAIVPHHGTLLRVAADGSRTDIVANGFRAANGVCVNGDGSYYVTDQEGHWTPKNRINRVVEGGFYGNMFGYHERASNADRDMEQPLCWLTNAFDRSPAELLRVPHAQWGLATGSLLQLSYGMGRAYLVLEDQVDSVHQGAMVALPIPVFATGVMRGRFHPVDGQLYCCGLYGWSGARTRPGGFYRVRYTGKPVATATGMKVVEGGIELSFGVALERELAADVESYGVKSWSLKRTKNYGSKHHDERVLAVRSATVSANGKSVRLAIPGLAPTMGLEVKCDLETESEEVLRVTIHGTVHRVR